jgi:hypothetical protein
VSNRTLLKQFVLDLKTSWPKTALLSGLLCVGLYFWLPPLYRAIVGHSSTTTPLANAGAVPVTLPAIETATQSPASPQTSSIGANDHRSGHTWQIVDDLLRNDPLMQSAEVAEVAGDAFRIDYDQFAPPLLFADEPNENDKQQPTESGKSDGDNPLDELVLKSTIVGASRRAALINQKLYREGTDILVNGRTYRLETVFPRKVLLRRGEEQFELTIAGRDRSGTVDLKRE